jgi:GNAT superfamily N-acetyltransferase
VSRRLVNLTLDNLDDLPPRCRSCVFWELDPVSGERACDAGSAELEKEAWVSDTLLEWGSCGQLVYVDGVPAGYMLYAPPAYVPRSVAFPTSPVSSDAVLVMAARLMPEFRGGGLGRMLVQGAARDAARRGVRALEAFGRMALTADEHRDPEGGPSTAGFGRRGGAVTPRGRGAGGTGGVVSRLMPSPPSGAVDCLLPTDYLLAVGFKTVRPHPHTPRLRLDIKTTATWKEDVEYAIERLLGSMQSPAMAR